jgi:hypothetical protein
MNETIDYIGERYPDLVDPDLQELHQVGIRFCQPAINNVMTVPALEAAVETAVVDAPDAAVTEVATSEAATPEAAAPEETATAEAPLSPTSEAGSEATQDQNGDANAA